MKAPILFSALFVPLVIHAADSTPVVPQPDVETNAPLSHVHRIPAASIKEFGIYRVAGKKSPDTNEALPNKTQWVYSNSVVAFELITNQIPGRLGLHFGLAYEVSGLSPFVLTNVLVTLSHPEIKAPDGRRTSGSRWFSGLATDAKGRGSGWTGYLFESPYEIAFGEWTFEVSLRGTPLVQKTFTIVPSDVTTNETMREMVTRANRLAKSETISDKLQAARMWSVAGKLGDPECQFRVATFIEARAARTNGTDSKCVPWYWVAATNRHPKAMQRLRSGIPVEAWTNLVVSWPTGTDFTRSNMVDLATSTNLQNNSKFIVHEARFEPGIVYIQGGKLLHRAAFTGSLTITHRNGATVTVRSGLTREEVKSSLANTGLIIDEYIPNQMRVFTTSLIFKDDVLVAMEHPNSMTGMFVPFTLAFRE